MKNEGILALFSKNNLSSDWPCLHKDLITSIAMRLRVVRQKENENETKRIIIPRRRWKLANQKGNK